MQPGAFIDEKFQIVREIGHGGFGYVYDAVQLQLQRHVALKMLHTTLLLDPDTLPRFEREGRAISSLKHKNIVGFFGYGVWQGAPYMVMELIDGTSMQKVLTEQRKIEAERALRIFRQICEALACAHSMGVVHRDLKPSNIMLVDEGTEKESVRIIDFGLAKLMPGYGLSAQKLTETGYSLGTCHYMSPEQALGGGVDHRSDIYAAGCILFQMITGRVPFDADNNVAVIFQQLNEAPPPLSEFVEVPPKFAAVSTLIHNCMVKDADDRYQTANEVIQDIDQVLKGGGAAVELRASKPLPNNRARKMPPNAALLLGAFAMCMLGVFAVYALQNGSELTTRTDLQRIENLVRHAGLNTRTDAQYAQMLEAWRGGLVKKLSEDDQKLFLSELIDGNWDEKRNAVRLDDQTKEQMYSQFFNLVTASKVPPTARIKWTLGVVNSYYVDHPESITGNSDAAKFARACYRSFRYGKLWTNGEDATSNETKCFEQARLAVSLRPKVTNPDPTADSSLLEMIDILRDDALTTDYCTHALSNHSDVSIEFLDRCYDLLCISYIGQNKLADAALNTNKFVDNASPGYYRAQAALHKANLFLLRNDPARAQEWLTRDPVDEPSIEQGRLLTLARIAFARKDFASARKFAAQAEHSRPYFTRRRMRTGGTLSGWLALQPRLLRIAAANRLGLRREQAEFTNELYKRASDRRAFSNEDGMAQYDWRLVEHLLDRHKIFLPES